MSVDRSNCACVSDDPFACVRMRYGRPPRPFGEHRDDDDECACACHEDYDPDADEE